jgi:Restriction endonuclease
MAQEAFSIGDHVHVPWGLDVVDGVVVNTYGEGDSRQVVVRVLLPDARDQAEDGEDITVTLPAQMLEEAEAEAEERRPGAWLPALRYERRLKDALAEILNRQWGDRALVQDRESLAQELVEQGRADIEVKLPDRTIIVEVKAPTSGVVPEGAVTAFIAALAAAQVTSLAQGASGLLVTNGELSKAAEDHLRSAAQEGMTLRAVQWRNPRDNRRLARALDELLAA